MYTRFWQDWGVFIAGLCMIWSTFALSQSFLVWNLGLTGFAVMLLAALAILGRSWPQVGAQLVGVWLIAAPFVLGFESLAALAGYIGVGFLLIVLASWRLIRSNGARGFRPGAEAAAQRRTANPD